MMDTEMKFAWIPPGRFDMGPATGADKSPAFRCTFSKGFWMGVTPVTQAQFRAVMGYNPSFHQGSKFEDADQHPVENVSWFDAKEFCKVLADMTGKPIRLPTEAQWEYASRAGTSTQYWNGDGDEALKLVGWYDLNSARGFFSKGETHAVASFKSPIHPWGLFDVHGNVFEWCEDWFGPYATGDQSDPIGPPKGELRLCRGGDYGSASAQCSARFRNSLDPSHRSNGAGFRVCFDALPDAEE